MGQDFNSSGTHVNGMAIQISSAAVWRGVLTWDGSVVVNSGATLAVVGTWYHVVLTRAGNPGTWAIYVNASLLNGGQVAPFAVTQNDSAFGIGQLPTSGLPFGGSIDEVAIYGTALSQAQVQAHFDARNSAGGGGAPTKSPPTPFVATIAANLPPGLGGTPPGLGGEPPGQAKKQNPQSPAARRRTLFARDPRRRRH
jgi:hypothetical protein